MSIIEITPKQADAVARRAQAVLAGEGKLSNEDIAVMRNALDTWTEIAEELVAGKMSMRRLREILGAPTPSEIPPTKSNEQPSGGSPSGREPHGANPGGGKNANHHGRRSAKDHPEAKKEIHEHPEFRLGQACPHSSCTGKLYPFKRDGLFRTSLRISGGAALRAETHEFHDLRCNLCGEVFAVPPPPSLLADGPIDQMYGYSAIATVALYKYLGGTPWYRQAKLLDQLGIDISPSTQWDLCELLANALKPLYDHAVGVAANAHLFFADDATFPILAEKAGETKKRRSDGKDVHRDGCHTSCIIAEVDGRRLALFKTGIIHAGEWMDEVLSKRHSGLAPPMYMADRSSSNPATVCPVIDLACNAHLRNRFDDIKKHFRLLCGKGLDLYKKIYKIDKATADMDDAARLAHLQEHATPLMDELFRLAKSEIDNNYTEPNGQLGKVFQYAINHEAELRGFLKYPGAPLDNNCCEAMLARIVMLRKNAWFYKNLVGAWVSDVIMTLGQTAILVDANPYDYYLEVLRHQGEVRERPADFMPWNYRATLDALSQRTAAAS